MAQSFPEKAHLRTDLKKLHENWDAIDWTIKKKEPEEGEVIFTNPMTEMADLSDPVNAYLWENGIAPVKSISLEELKKLYPAKE